MNSKRKGKVGELEASKELARILKCEARRGQQFAGGADSPDIVHSIPGVHVEVKRKESLRLYKALAQAIDDAKNGEAPIVLHRQNKQPWVVVVRLDDLPALATAVYLQLAEQA